jgi:hypothetical protein
VGGAAVVVVVGGSISTGNSTSPSSTVRNVNAGKLLINLPMLLLLAPLKIPPNDESGGLEKLNKKLPLPLKVLTIGKSDAL